ncbi:DUF2061 domain-containing protein [Halopelagius fulvigenes]|uniref:DUF2061 domain-containing protein n=1 Tax=Halopelagius fulvigenes TaxID=1198324 RepID=A0ABD5TT64_9EURY
MICKRPHQGWSRLLVKTVLYRVFTLALTVGLVWYVLGDPMTALNIGVAMTIAKTALYLVYERIWDHITWNMSS